MRQKKVSHRVGSFPAEFRIRVVKLFLEEGYSIDMLSEEFKCSKSSILKWIKAYREHGESGLHRPNTCTSKAHKGLDPNLKSKIIEQKKDDPQRGIKRIPNIMPTQQSNVKKETFNPEKIKKMQRNKVRFSNILFFSTIKIAYIGIPKAANTSIKYWLLPLVGKENIETSNIHKRNIGYVYCNNKWLFEHKDSCFVFTVVRNPWSRLYSTYRDKIKRKNVHTPLKKLGFENSMSFKDFIKKCCDIPDNKADVHIRSQSAMLMWQGTLLPNLIIKMEQLADVSNIIESVVTTHSDKKLGKLPWKNKNNDGVYKEVYDDETKELVALRYERDIRLFGYSF